MAKTDVDFKKLNGELIQLIDKRNELSELDYNDEEYDTIEEDLHDLEDEFLWAVCEPLSGAHGGSPVRPRTVSSPQLHAS